MRAPRIRLAILGLVSGVALSGCAYGMYGDDYGYGYGYRPYGSVSVGIGYGGYGYNPYYGYGGYGYDPFGWYDDYYYPGVGFYVYDRHHHRHNWTDQQRRYWEDRRGQWQSHHGTAVGASATTENWSGWNRSHWRNSSGATGTRDDWRGDRSNWQSRSSVTTSGTSTRSMGGDRGGGHHSSEGARERPQ